MRTSAQSSSKPVVPAEFDAAQVDKLSHSDLVALLRDPQATVFQKAKACQRLAHMGAADAVPAMAALLGHPQLGHYARYGLEPLPGPEADEALRNALPRLKGSLLVGAINSLGRRKNPQAVASLSKLMYAEDSEVGRAAAAALGAIGGLPAAKALLEALGKTRGPVRAGVAAGGLLCAERLLEMGERNQALALYDKLTATDIPKPVRLAAMHGIIAAETSLGRPR